MNLIRIEIALVSGKQDCQDGKEDFFREAIDYMLKYQAFFM